MNWSEGAGRSSGRWTQGCHRWHALITLSLFHLITVAWPVSARAADRDTPAPLALRVAKVVALDDADTVINDAVVLVRNERIEAVGPAAEIQVPSGYRVLEFREHWLVPGIVEAHNHSAAGSWGDLNDMVYQTNPGLDIRSVPVPDNDWIKAARRGGVTTVLLIPGSGTNLAGMGTVVSSAGRTPDEITVRTPGSLKVSQAGNPEWYFGGNGRMFMNWNLRQTLQKAREYARRHDGDHRPSPSLGEHRRPVGNGEHRPRAGSEDTRPLGGDDETVMFDPIWEPFRPVFAQDIPVLVHTQTYQLVMMTITMITREFDLWTIIGHGTFDAWKFGPIVRTTDAWVVNGPRQYEFDRTARRMIGNVSGWWKNGVRRLGVNTDAPVIPQEELTYQAAMACWYGWLPYPALRGITNITSKSLGVYEQVGSVEPGKQADLSIWTGDPIDPRSACLMTIVKGKIEYDGTQGLRRF